MRLRVGLQNSNVPIFSRWLRSNKAPTLQGKTCRSTCQCKFSCLSSKICPEAGTSEYLSCGNTLVWIRIFTVQAVGRTGRFPSPCTQAAVNHRNVGNVCFPLPTKFHELPLLALLHFRGELELGQDVLFEHHDDFLHRRLQNGASRDLVQARKRCSVNVRCARQPQKFE